jgi:hypothetical protein
MPDKHYENPKLAGPHDLDSPWSIDRKDKLFNDSLPETETLTG